MWPVRQETAIWPHLLKKPLMENFCYLTFTICYRQCKDFILLWNSLEWLYKVSLLSLFSVDTTKKYNNKKNKLIEIDANPNN